jgi:hypothetical protein
MMFHTGWREPSPSADAATAKLVLDATDGSEIPRFVVSGPGEPQETSMARAATAGSFLSAPRRVSSDRPVRVSSTWSKACSRNVNCRIGKDRCHASGEAQILLDLTAFGP